MNDTIKFWSNYFTREKESILYQVENNLYKNSGAMKKWLKSHSFTKLYPNLNLPPFISIQTFHLGSISNLLSQVHKRVLG